MQTIRTRHVSGRLCCFVTDADKEEEEMLIDQETLKMTKYEIVNRFNKSNGLSLGRKLSSAPPATLSYDANVPKSWLVYFRPKKSCFSCQPRRTTSAPFHRKRSLALNLFEEQFSSAIKFNIRAAVRLQRKCLRL